MRGKRDFTCRVCGKKTFYFEVLVGEGKCYKCNKKKERINNESITGYTTSKQKV